ncbi:MAG: hypothetical protein QW279_02975 [Candidatus Jordarchaeaceae archaeon]
MIFENIMHRIRLGVHYLDNNSDPKLGGLPYSGGIITGPAAYRSHGEWDAGDTGWRMIEAYILARQVLDQPNPGLEEQKLRAFVISNIKDDGLCYRPEMPWCRAEAWMWDHGRALIALATWLRLEPSGKIAKIAKNMVAGLEKIAIREGEFWVYPAENWTGTKWGSTVYAHPPTGLTIEGLVDLSKLLHDERLLELAGHFVKSVMSRKPLIFSEDGSLIPKGGGPYDFWFTHVHSRLAILIGLIKYALSLNDKNLLDWCIRCYLFVKEKMSSSFGWVPESLESGTDPEVKFLSTKRRDEVCCISDMMQIAAILANNGRPEERQTIGYYGMNHLLAHQNIDFTPYKKLMDHKTGLEDTLQISYKGMPEVALGSFTAGSYPNELAIDLRSFGAQQYTIDVAGCCSSSGIKALYVLWREAVQYIRDILHIHLWVTMENHYVNMICEEPFNGRLCIKLKQNSREMVIHVPDYIDPEEVSVNHKCEIHERSLYLNKKQKGDIITLSYPIYEQTKTEFIGGNLYNVLWRGGRVIDVLPPAVGCKPYWWRQNIIK